MQSTAQRAVLTGLSVNFGLVSFQVDLVPAKISSKDTTMKSVCPTCETASPLRQRLYCDADHGPFTIAEARKAMEIDGALRFIDTDKVTAAKSASTDTRTMDLRVYPADQIEPYLIPAGTVYRLRPSRPKKGADVPKGVQQAYALVHALAGNADVAFLTEVVVRKVSKMYRVIAHAGTLTLIELVRPHEIAEPDEQDLDCDGRILDAAENLVAALMEDFDPGEWRDEAQERLRVLRAELAEDETAALPSSRPEAAVVAQDLIKLLHKSAA